jgi:hypothetical protein
MAKINETPTTLRIEIGMPKFNGCVATMDRGKRTLMIERTDFFVRSKPREVAFDEIAGIVLKRVKHAAYPQVLLKSGKILDMPSAGSADAEAAVPRMIAFLGS